MMWVSFGCMLRVLIWCNVGSCSRVSGVMGVAMVVCLMHEGNWCDGGRCVCVSVFVC